jgi:hypothetical protein
MTISYREEVAVLEATKVGNGDPSVLILLIWIGGGLTSFCRKSKFSNAVSKHLFRISGVERVVKVQHLRLG